MSIKTNHTTNEITLGTTTLAVDNNGVLIGTDQLANPVNISGIPIGTIVEAPSAPTDGVWLECDGSSYLKADYPELGSKSPNAFTWTENTTFDALLMGPVVKIPTNEWLVASYETAGGYYKTSDFMTFQHVLTGYQGNGSVAFNSGGILLVTVENAGIEYIARSLDWGATWSFVANPIVSAYSKTLYWDENNSLFIVTTFNVTAFYTSPDGITWTARTKPMAGGISGIVNHGDGTTRLIFGDFSTNSYTIYTTADYVSFDLVVVYPGSGSNVFDADDFYYLDDRDQLICFDKKTGGISRITIPGSDSYQLWGCGNTFRAGIHVGSTTHYFMDVEDTYDMKAGLRVLPLVTRNPVTNTTETEIHTLPAEISFDNSLTTNITSPYYGAGDDTTVIFVVEEYGPGWDPLIAAALWVGVRDATRFVVSKRYTNHPNTKYYIKASN